MISHQIIYACFIFFYHFFWLTHVRQTGIEDPKILALEHLGKDYMKGDLYQLPSIRLHQIRLVTLIWRPKTLPKSNLKSKQTVTSGGPARRAAIPPPSSLQPGNVADAEMWGIFFFLFHNVWNWTVLWGAFVGYLIFSRASIFSWSQKMSHEPCFQHNAGSMALWKCNKWLGCIPFNRYLTVRDLIETADWLVARL